MSATFQPGDVLKHRDHDRYLRVLPLPHARPGATFVVDVDQAGFRLSSGAQWRSIVYLERVYELHHRGAA